MSELRLWLQFLSKDEIEMLGGENAASILKQNAGGSLSDLRINRAAGMVCSVRKGALYGNEVGYLMELMIVNEK